MTSQDLHLTEFSTAWRSQQAEILLSRSGDKAVAVVPWHSSIPNNQQVLDRAATMGFTDIVEIGNCEYHIEGLDTDDCDYYLLEASS